MVRHRSRGTAATKARPNDRQKLCGNISTAAVSNLPDVLPIAVAELDVLESYLGELLKDMFEGSLGPRPRNLLQGDDDEQKDARGSLSEGVDRPAG